MLLVLTYHRIVDTPGAITGFFDVSASELDQHLQAAVRIWGAGADPALVSKESHSSERAGFLVTFDDGTTDHYSTAAPLLERSGLRGVFFVSTALLGSPGYMTVEQCQELQKRGHFVESHSHDHKVLVGLEPDEMRKQFLVSRQLLRELGLGQAEFFAVPGGYFDLPVVESAKASGYLALRTIEWGYNRRLEPFRIQSITVNRKTAGWLGLLLSPRFELLKKAIYRSKEVVKGSLPALYSSILHRRRQ